MTSELAVQDRTTDLERVRFAVTAARQIAAIGTGKLAVRAGPTLDSWSAEGEDRRTVAGAQAAVALQLPAGPVVVEQVLGFGWSAGPFRTAELPAGYHRQRLRTISVGLGLVVGL